MLQTIVAAAASLVRRKRVLMWADHVKLESPSILTKIVFFGRPLGGGAGPPVPPVYASGSNGLRRGGSNEEGGHDTPARPHWPQRDVG